MIAIIVVAAALLAQGPAQDRMDWFQDAKFGLFIHWGPVSLKGTEIGWSRGGERRGTGGTGTIPVEEYDNLYKRFNPVKFDARAWVRLAKEAGAEYIVFTTKHHDGFCMFDSALTDYKITNSPFQRDVVKELADACRLAGMRLGFYYSPPDWHHPDYRTDRHAEYVKYLHGQIRELLTNYGKVDILWFDGLGGTAKNWDAETLIKMARELQPGIIINNRAGLPGDYDTPEQQIGEFRLDRPWESCITIGDQWAYKPNDRVKSLQECVGTLVRCAGGGGNLLLNVGPTPEGEIEAEQAQRLREIGGWLRVNDWTLRGTRGGPFKPGKWGASTRKDDFIYLHVLDWEGLDLVLPPTERQVLAVDLPGGGRIVPGREDGSIRLEVPPQYHDPIDTVIRVKLDGPASDIRPLLLVRSGSVAFGKAVKASNVFQGMPEYGPEKATDDDDTTRWATDDGTASAWLEADLGAPRTVNRVRIHEAYSRRVHKFRIEYEDAGEWRTALEGTEIGERFEAAFDPVAARRFRLNILEAAEGPTIWEFQLFGPEG